MILVNANKIDFIENESLYELLERTNFNPDLVAVEVDQGLVKRDQFKEYLIKDGANIEVVSFVGGG